MVKKFKRKKFEQIFDETFLKKGGYKWPEKKVFKFTWDYCATCDTMFVRCPACGNNCCNAGFGTVTKDIKPLSHGDPKGIDCPICNLAYQFQHLAWKTKEAPPEPSKKEKKRLREENEEAMNRLFG